MTEAQLLFSPRLAALQHSLTSGNEAALDLFWQEMEAVGTPLIESITRDDSQVLVTFLYHAPLAVRSVEVVCPLAGRGQINEPMTRLLATSLWYKTYRVRPGLRTEYRFSVDGVAHRCKNTLLCEHYALSSKRFLKRDDERIARNLLGWEVRTAMEEDHPA
jgi:hypothetical protein